MMHFAFGERAEEEEVYLQVKQEYDRVQCEAVFKDEILNIATHLGPLRSITVWVAILKI